MAGFGRFKLTDALPDQPAADEESAFRRGNTQASSPAGKGKGKGKKKGKLAGDQSKLSQAQPARMQTLHP